MNNNMNYNQFKKIRVIVAALTAVVMSFAVVLQSWPLAIADVLISMAVMLVAKSQVKNVIADERDYYIAGKAARYTQAIVCIMGAILTFYFMALSKNPAAEAIGSVLGFCVCSVLMLNSIIVIYLERHEKQN
jgi:uncharacterized membrane protein